MKQNKTFTVLLRTYCIVTSRERDACSTLLNVFVEKFRCDFALKKIPI